MITLSKGGAYLIGGTEVVETGAGSEELLKNKLGDKYLYQSPHSLVLIS